MICNFGLFVVQTYLGHVFTVKQRIVSCSGCGNLCKSDYCYFQQYWCGEILTSLNALPKSALK